MSQVMQYEFRLFGPRKGQTVTINGHPFVNGRVVLVQASQNMEACMKVLSFYGAFARGTPPYDEALAQEEAEDEIPTNVEAEHGASEVYTETVKGSDAPVPTSVRPDGAGFAKEAAVDGSGSDHTKGADGSSGDPSGDGHGHAGIPKFPEDKDRRVIEPPSQVNEIVKIAVLKLDPEVDQHWVMTGAHKGKPKLQEVESAYGKAGLTRQDIEAAAPGWTRDYALEAALAKA